MALNGNGWMRWIVMIVAAVIASAVVGGYSGSKTEAFSQGQLNTKVEENTKDIASNAKDVKEIPVLVERIGNLDEKVETLKKESKERYDSMVIKMDNDKQEVLRAIERTR